jgi:DNA invertase Pin-like site-specific DNA recombinase
MQTTEKRAVGYIRVSSKGQDYEMQRAAIGKAAAARGVAVAEWFEEKRSATKSMARPEMDRLRDAMRAGSVQLVFAFRLDRLMRTGPADAFKFAEECHQHGVELQTVSDGVRVVPGTDDIATSVLLFAFSLCAKLEAAGRAERIAAARELTEAKGERWGRPTRLTPLECARVAALAQQGLSVRAIAERTKASKSVIGRAVRALSQNPQPAQAM